MSLLKKADKAIQILQTKGIKGLLEKFRHRSDEKTAIRQYQKWIEKYDLPSDAKRQQMLREIAFFAHRPLISIILPVYDIEEKWLRLCIESVLNQIYENWELCIADDFSPSPHIRKVLEEYAAKDKRIKVVFRPQNGHISAASNSALELADGEFAALLDHDDELAENALFYVVKEINSFSEADLIYSDEDMIDPDGNRFQPRFKPDWSRDFFYSLNLITHLAVYRLEILRRIGGFQIGLEGSQDYDLALRFAEEIPENHIRHIPQILYHWRAIPGSVALGGEQKPYAHASAREAISAHFERTGKKARVLPTIQDFHRVRYDLPDNPPKVSLILTADEDFEFTRKSVQNFIEQTGYANFQIIIVRADGGSEDFNLPDVKIFNHNSINQAEKLNFAVAQTNGEILCFAEANLKPLANDWLAELTSFAAQKEIGAVGAKILSDRETVLHGGLLIGLNKSVGIAHFNLQRENDGNYFRAKLISNFSAVSISGLTVRRKIFEEIGGFDAENLPNALFDADFCLKLREKNYRIVFTPYAELIKVDKQKRLHLEENSTVAEKDYFAKKWSEIIKRDPFYNPNLSKRDASFSIDIEPRNHTKLHEFFL